jgi:membrane metallo-endopeptidase-like protein 1
MDLDQIEHIGLEPLKDILKTFGGWPVLETEWDESNFKW